MTCRSPYLELAQFQKDVAVVLPNSKRINRGGYFLNDLVILCLTKGLSDVVILHGHRGKPGGLIVCHMHLGPTVYFSF
jgi:U3 small nucleolar ribonucleoprotein protein IMP4